MREVIKIYLAGKMSGLSFKEMNAWREELKSKLLMAADGLNMKLIVVNPVDYFNFEVCLNQTESEVKEFDLRHVTTSDIVVVNLDGLSTSDGTKYELHDAKYHNRIPVIAFGDKREYENLHPWTKDNITRVEENMNDVVKYISWLYFNYAEE